MLVCKLVPSSVGSAVLCTEQILLQFLIYEKVAWHSNHTTIMSYPKVTEYLHSLTNAISPVLVMCRRGDCIAIVTTERRDMKITNRHNTFVITASIKPQQQQKSADCLLMLLCAKHDLVMYFISTVSSILSILLVYLCLLLL